MSLVRPEVPGLGPEVPGSGSSRGGRKFRGSHKKCRGLWVNSLFSPEVPGKDGSSGGRKFRGRPEVPGVVEFLPGRTLNSRSENGGGKSRFPRSKLGRFRGWKGRKRWGKARSTCNQANPWIKINKTSSNQQITKKIWGYFWWAFSKFWMKSHKRKARKRWQGVQIRDQRGS